MHSSWISSFKSFFKLYSTPGHQKWMTFKGRYSSNVCATELPPITPIEYHSSFRDVELPWDVCEMLFTGSLISQWAHRNHAHSGHGAVVNQYTIRSITVSVPFHDGHGTGRTIQLTIPWHYRDPSTKRRSMALDVIDGNIRIYSIQQDRWGPILVVVHDGSTHPFQSMLSLLTFARRVKPTIRNQHYLFLTRVDDICQWVIIWLYKLQIDLRAIFG